jgi:hypothetical protein
MSLWSQYFGKDPKELFLTYTPEGSTWRVVSWNFDLQNPGSRKWSVESHQDKKALIEWEVGPVNELRFYENDRLLRKRRLPPDHHELQGFMNLTIHSTLKYALEDNHSFLLRPVSGVTTLDYQNEMRALQWIQASFGTLSRALDQFSHDPSLILTAVFFSGAEPGSGDSVLRMLAFNLDIFCYFRSDFSLQIVVFDDKNQGHGSSKAPTFQQIIKVTKPQFYDEIVKLVHKVAMVGEIR